MLLESGDDTEGGLASFVAGVDSDYATGQGWRRSAWLAGANYSDHVLKFRQDISLRPCGALAATESPPHQTTT